MVFSDGQKRSVKGILDVFERFEQISGLKISLEKSKLFMAGVNLESQQSILECFPFDSGQLPVRYLGLPLLPKKMTIVDYLPLVEKIRKRMSSWTGRFLSYAGRLQLINSVIMSLTNFWLAAFRLPGSCLKDIEKLCTAFLWSGPDLCTKKAKISWKESCKPKHEGGLGLRSLKEMNLVTGLKLIWRLNSNHCSLWVSWVNSYLIRKGSFWSISGNTSSGSWVWRKLLKLRDVAKNFHRIEIRSGQQTSFWYDAWSEMGRLKEVLGDRGTIDLGIPENATVADALTSRRRRRHRTQTLNDIESILQNLQGKVDPTQLDIPMWKTKVDRYRGKFSSKETWELIRHVSPQCPWSDAIWFRHNTPKYSFLMWVAVNNRLSTCDRMKHWNANVDDSCVLCNGNTESRSHLFFECVYIEWIWNALTRDLLSNRYTSVWEDLINLASDQQLSGTTGFLLRYSLQASVHMIWSERNSRKHGNQPVDKVSLLRSIDKAVRNRITSIREEGYQDHNDAMQVWFNRSRSTAP